jgi:hypothetical protein
VAQASGGNIPGFNAEIALKALEKRVDRIDNLLAAMEKQVKVLVETRGASKEKAVEELLKTMPEMREADRKLTASVSLLAAQISRDRAEFDKQGAATQAALSKEFEAAQKEQTASLDALEKELKTRFDAQAAQSRTLWNQHVQAIDKRHVAKTQRVVQLNEELTKEALRLGAALKERARLEAGMEGKLAALRGQVQTLEAAVARLSK